MLFTPRAVVVPVNQIPRPQGLVLPVGVKEWRLRCESGARSDAARRLILTGFGARVLLAHVGLLERCYRSSDSATPQDSPWWSWWSWCAWWFNLRLPTQISEELTNVMECGSTKKVAEGDRFLAPAAHTGPRSPTRSLRRVRRPGCHQCLFPHKISEEPQVTGANSLRPGHL